MRRSLLAAEVIATSWDSVRVRAFALSSNMAPSRSALSTHNVVAGPHVGLQAFADQRQQVRTLAPAQGLHGQVHFAALNLQRRILGQRRLHLPRQATLTDLEPLHLHDMGPVY